MIRDILFSVVALPVVFFMHYFVYCFLYKLFGTAGFWDILTIFLVTQGVQYFIVGMLLLLIVKFMLGVIAKHKTYAGMYIIVVSILSCIWLLIGEWRMYGYDIVSLSSAIFSTISMLHFTLWMSIAALSIE